MATRAPRYVVVEYDLHSFHASRLASAHDADITPDLLAWANRLAANYWNDLNLGIAIVDTTTDTAIWRDGADRHEDGTPLADAITWE